MRLRLLAFPLAALLCGSRLEAQSPEAPAARPVSIFAVNGTVEVLEKIGAAFTRATGTSVEVTGGTSPALASKILSGAGADIFVASSSGVLTQLLRTGMVNEDSSYLWATNSLLVVAAPGADSLAAPRDLAARRFRHIAIPNPDATVPGPFVRQALESAGVWEDLRGRLILTANAEKALDLVGAGDADLAIVYATDARRRAKTRAVLALPPKSHQPIPYPVALVAHPGASPFARPMLDFLKSPEARVLLEEAGFTPAFP